MPYIRSTKRCFLEVPPDLLAPCIKCHLLSSYVFRTRKERKVFKMRHIKARVSFCAIPDSFHQLKGKTPHVETTTCNLTIFQSVEKNRLCYLLRFFFFRIKKNKKGRTVVVLLLDGSKPASSLCFCVCDSNSLCFR